MILSDRDIRAALQRLENPLIIDPGFDPGRLQPASLELTLAEDVLIEVPIHIRNAHNIAIVNEVRWEPRSLHEPERMGAYGHKMGPGAFWLGSTVEKVHIPTDLVAQVNGKSSWARKGLIVHTTAGFVDPGFRGQITLELKNVSGGPLLLTAGTPICQLVFTQLTSPAERPYGTPGLRSHYQGQSGVTPAAEV